MHKFSSGWPASHGLWSRPGLVLVPPSFLLPYSTLDSHNSSRWSQLISLSRSLFKPTSSHELMYYLKSVFLVTKYSPHPAWMPRKRKTTAQLPPRVTATKSCARTCMSLLPPLGAVCSLASWLLLTKRMQQKWCLSASGLGLSSLRNQLPPCKEAQASLRNNERSHGRQTQGSRPPAPAQHQLPAATRETSGRPTQGTHPGGNPCCSKPLAFGCWSHGNAGSPHGQRRSVWPWDNATWSPFYHGPIGSK